MLKDKPAERTFTHTHRWAAMCEMCGASAWLSISWARPWSPLGRLAAAKQPGNSATACAWRVRWRGGRANGGHMRRSGLRQLTKDPVPHHLAGGAGAVVVEEEELEPAALDGHDVCTRTRKQNDDRVLGPSSGPADWTTGVTNMPSMARHGQWPAGRLETVIT